MKNYSPGRLLLIIVFCLILFDSFAQNQIRVIDAETGGKLAGATVKNLTSGAIFITDSAGFVSILTEPTDWVRISFVGFDPLVILSKDIRKGQVQLNKASLLLNEIMVQGFEANRKLIETAGGISIISAQEFERYGEESLVPVLNSVPGVRMEERAFSSYRISIRGSLLRSPFGVRNLKVYWNGLPLTEPNGNTPFNLLDFNNVQSIEILKGPAGSIYGAGTGGVILLKSTPADFKKNQIELGGQSGSFASNRISGKFQTAGEKANVKLNLNHQTSDGYRDHNGMYRITGQFLGQFQLNKNQNLGVLIMATDLDYEIPGGLNESQYLQNPRQSRPGSIEQNASVQLKSMQAGLTHYVQFNPVFSNNTAIYGITSNFRNPFITDFKKDDQIGWGGRTLFSYDVEWGVTKIKVSLGGEYQKSAVDARNFGNVSGIADTLRFDDNILTSQALIFAKFDFDLSKNWIITGGLSLNYVTYDIDRVFDAITNAPSRTKRTFDPEVSPRIGFIRKLNNNTALHGSISFGFSPPTLQEFRTNEGSLNTNLQAERGINYELGYRGTALNQQLNFDIALFWLQLSETIVTRTAPSGVVLFENTGDTKQPGAELFLDYKIFDQPGALVSKVKLKTSYSYHPFRFNNYIKTSDDFSGNDLTGVAPHILVSGLDIESSRGFFIHLTHNFTDRIPLNDANTTFSRPYHLMLIKTGVKKSLGQVTVEAFLGINNLLDQTMSLGNDLNAFGNRFFQPAPERNYYGGVKFGYHWDSKK